jgi:hypothetical protein
MIPALKELADVAPERVVYAPMTKCSEMPSQTAARSQRTWFALAHRVIGRVIHRTTR